jgi:hypothetical protein
MGGEVHSLGGSLLENTRSGLALPRPEGPDDGARMGNADGVEATTDGERTSALHLAPADGVQEPSFADAENSWAGPTSSLATTDGGEHYELDGSSPRLLVGYRPLNHPTQLRCTGRSVRTAKSRQNSRGVRYRYRVIERVL